MRCSSFKLLWTRPGWSAATEPEDNCSKHEVAREPVQAQRPGQHQEQHGPEAGAAAGPAAAVG